jgi:hypothetical protein
LSRDLFALPVSSLADARRLALAFPRGVVGVPELRHVSGRPYMPRALARLVSVEPPSASLVGRDARFNVPLVWHASVAILTHPTDGEPGRSPRGEWSDAERMRAGRWLDAFVRSGLDSSGLAFEQESPDGYSVHLAATLDAAELRQAVANLADQSHPKRGPLR